jgi:hypothetical protein
MEIIIGLFDETGAPITGLASTTLVKVRRCTDGYFLDWNDGTFKNTAWTTIAAAANEISATNMPGYYNRTPATATWSDGWYSVSYTATMTDGRQLAEVEDVMIIAGKESDEVIANVENAFGDADTLPANSLRERLRTLGWILRNKIEIADSDGDTVIYKDDSATSAFTVAAMFTDSSGTSRRLRAA